MAHVQGQLTNFWEENQSLASHIRDQLAQFEAGLMDLREALNHAVNTTREADELNSRNQERLKEALVSPLASCPLFLPCMHSSHPPSLPSALLSPFLSALSSSPLPLPSSLFLAPSSPSPSFLPGDAQGPTAYFIPTLLKFHPKQWKQELFRDNATIKAALQAARLTLGRVSELLQGMDQAKEVNIAPPSHSFLACSSKMSGCCPIRDVLDWLACSPKLGG